MGDLLVRSPCASIYLWTLGVAQGAQVAPILSPLRYLGQRAVVAQAVPDAKPLIRRDTLWVKCPAYPKRFAINSTTLRGNQNRPDFADAEKLFLLFKHPLGTRSPQGHDGSYFCSSPSTSRDSDSPGP
jgi:hypothetical protein